MSAGEAPGEIIMAIGSPGTTRSRTKTMMHTPNNVGGMRTSRLMISPHLIGVSPRLTPYADVINCGRTMPLACDTTFSPFLWMIGCTYWNSGITSPSSAMYLSTAFQPAIRLASSFSPHNGPMRSMVSLPFQAQCGDGPNIAKPVEVEGSPIALPQL